MNAPTVGCPDCKTVCTTTPGSFRDTCPRCEADLHVCLTCSLYDTYVENACREPTADPVQQKDRRNLCEFWSAKAPGDDGLDASQVARKKLEALFGGAKQAEATASGAPSASSTAQSALSPQEEAKRKLEALFQKKPKP